jgi:hypothetical protein
MTIKEDWDDGLTTQHASEPMNTGHVTTRLGLSDVTVPAIGCLPPTFLVREGYFGPTVPTDDTGPDPNQAGGEQDTHGHIFFGSGIYRPPQMSAKYQTTRCTLSI